MGKNIVASLRWSFFSQISRLMTQLLSVLILVRLLPPSDYGLIAMATIVTGFVSLFRDFGTVAAIIQKPELGSGFLDSIFWFNTLLGIAFAAFVGLLAPVIAIGFAEPKLAGVLWGLVLTFPVLGIAAVHQAILERASRFFPLAVIESGAAMLGLFAAIVAATNGCGVYSLVVQALLTSGLTLIGVWGVSGWKPSLYWSFAEIKGTIRFSANLAGFNVFNYFIRNADNLLIGRFLGAADLGGYSIAYRLMIWPLQNISSVLGRVLFPVFSRLQGDHHSLSVAYIKATAAITLITSPLMLGFYVLREPFVRLFLGPQWQSVSEILAWLVPIGLLQTIGTTVGALYLATGRTDLMFKWSIATGLVVVPAFAVGLHWGVMGVTIAYFLVSLILFFPSLIIPYRLINLRVRNVMREISPSIMTAIMMALLLFACDHAWLENETNSMFRFLLLVVLGGGIYSVLSYFTQRRLLMELVHFLVKR